MRPSRSLILSLSLLLTACANGGYQVGTKNSAPVVSIVTPPDGSNFDEGEVVTFEGYVEDDLTRPNELLIQWTSDLDGVISNDGEADAKGNIDYITANLSPGNHAISLTAWDSEGENDRASVAITINPQEHAPDIVIVHPLSGEEGAEGVDYTFVVEVADEQTATPNLLVTFESDLHGIFCEPIPMPSGEASCDFSLIAGVHMLTFTVIDEEKLENSVTAYFTVIAGVEIDDDGDGYTETQGDCNDADSSVHPGATEFYNSRDDDCDGLVDEGTEGYDDDGDGWSEYDGDCDDNNQYTYPGAPEAYNSRDDDCDSVVDEGTEGYDDDGDGWTEIGGDCDDSRAQTYPNATELADWFDNDCDGVVDEGTINYDNDGDGWSAAAGDCDDTRITDFPGAPETCDGRDNNCTNGADEENAIGCYVYYADNDWDGYGSGQGHCLCSANGTYSSILDTDCYDWNADAFPGQSTYFPTHRGDSSYDYDCDGYQNKYYTATYYCVSSWYCFACDTYTEGWSGSASNCGAVGTWKTGCSASWCSCSNTGSYNLTQKCK